MKTKKSKKPPPKKTKLLTDVLAIDVGASSTKLVRMKHGKKQGFHVVAVGLIPPSDLSREAEVPLDVPRAFRTRYAAMSLSGKNVLIRLISVPGSVGNVGERIREQMHLDESYRIAHSLLRKPKGKGDGDYIVVGLPEQHATNVLSLLDSGPVAAVSLEASGLAALRAFDHAMGDVYREEAVVVVETGMNSIYMGIYSQGELALLRTFNFGESSLVGFVQDRLGISAEEAEHMINDGSFDITDAINHVMRPFFEQVNLSKDYIERRDKLRVRELCLSGGMAMSDTLKKGLQIGTAMPVRSWNPFEKLDTSHAVIPEELAGQECRFASAVGIALNAMVEG